MSPRMGLCLALATLAGCSRALPARYPTCTDPAPNLDAGSGPAPTYYGQVKAILDRHCISCHVAGGIGPFPLDTYAAAVNAPDDIARVVRARIMPPWMPDGCCGQFLQDPSLADADIATLVNWVSAGVPEGSPADFDAGPAPSPTGMSRVDLSLGMPAPYTPTHASEQRCFVLDWPEKETRFVTGLDLHTTNPSVVHHVIVYLADSRSADQLRAQEGQDGQPGVDCTTGVVNANITGAIGGWLPGSQGLDFPDGLGTRVDPGSAIILQVHYSLLHGGHGADQTQLLLELSDHATPIQGLTVGDLLWLVDSGMRIPAGAVNWPYRTELDPTALYHSGKPLLLYNVSLHMHNYATHGALILEHPDGSTECLLQISRWDLAWQGTYWFTSPRRVAPGDKLYLECDVTNPTDQDLVWSNTGEMCAAFGGYIDAPP